MWFAVCGLYLYLHLFTSPSLGAICYWNLCLNVSETDEIFRKTQTHSAFINRTDQHHTLAHSVEPPPLNEPTYRKAARSMVYKSISINKIYNRTVRKTFDVEFGFKIDFDFRLCVQMPRTPYGTYPNRYTTGFHCSLWMRISKWERVSCVLRVWFYEERKRVRFTVDQAKSMNRFIRPRGECVCGQNDVVRIEFAMTSTGACVQCAFEIFYELFALFVAVVIVQCDARWCAFCERKYQFTLSALLGGSGIATCKRRRYCAHKICKIVNLNICATTRVSRKYQAIN